MTAPYILTFSDTANTNNITILPVPQGPGVDIDNTSLTLVGPGYSNYGLPTAQNFLKLLENFASPTQPLNSIKGQLWYDTSNPVKPVLRINNGQVTSGRWPSASGVYQQPLDPSKRYSVTEGDIWVDTGINQLKIRFNDDWTIVGPTLQSGISKSGTEAVIIESITGEPFPIIKNWVNGNVVEIISYNSFTPKQVIDGFASIKIGINLTNRVLAKYNGLAEKASALEIAPGRLINANEVLRNNAAIQIHTGTLYVESIGGFNVRPGESSSPINLYSNLTNSAFINYSNSDLRSTMKIGIGNYSYLTFNAQYAGVGINKSLSSNSATLDVNGSGKFASTVTISTASTIALSVGGGATFGGKVASSSLYVSGTSTSVGMLTLGNSGNGIILKPGVTDQYDIGSSTFKFRTVYTTVVDATTIRGNVDGSANSLTSLRDFQVIGQSTSTIVKFNGTASVILNTVLTRSAITDQSSTSTAVGTHSLLVLNDSTSTSNLQKISKTNFLADVYPNLISTGMILPFSTSTNIPSGFLVCDGVSYSVSAYSSLYSVIGTTYGTGGAGTFRTPNMTTSTVIPGGIYLTYIIKT
jgi:hypothetical protein